jgi:hypothetical protein
MNQVAIKTATSTVSSPKMPKPTDRIVAQINAEIITSVITHPICMVEP